MPPKTKLPDFSRLALSPITLLRGAEEYFLHSATQALRELAVKQDPQVELIYVDASGYEPNMLQVWTSPSLFDEPRHIEIDAVDSANDAFLNDMITHIEQEEIPAEVTMVLRHRKGNRGKRLLDLIAAKKYPTIPCQPLKGERDKVAFAAQFFKQAKRDISPNALTVLVQATGSELSELAAACKQLAADTSGRITPDVVNTYYGGRVETTGFKVADAAVAGDVSTALTLLRHALSTGLDPVPLVAVLASKLRAMALVSVDQGGKMAPWQQQRARRELRGWSESGLARAMCAVADADAAVKGETRNPEYAVEKAVLSIAQARGH